MNVMLFSIHLKVSFIKDNNTVDVSFNHSFECRGRISVSLLSSLLLIHGFIFIFEFEIFQLSACFLVTAVKVCHVHMMSVNMTNCWHDVDTLFFHASFQPFKAPGSLFISRIHIGSMRLWRLLPGFCAPAMRTGPKIWTNNLDAPYSISTYSR